MQSITNSISTQTKLKALFKKATEHGLFSLNYDTYAHKALKTMAKKKDISMLHVRWDLAEIVSNIETAPTIFTDLICGFYTDKMEYEEEYFDTHLMEEMEKGRTIFVMFNLSNYFLLDVQYAEGRGRNKVTQDDRAYTHHCTCAIFEPDKDGNYNCFYINSHGIDMLDSTSFEIRVTRRRKKELKFTEPIDIMCLKAYFKHMKEFLETHSDSEIVINYNNTKEHNYYGTNLQAGDNFGICFAIPIVIWYYLSNYYNKRRLLRKEAVYEKHEFIVPSVREMLSKKQLILLVNSCFAGFHKDYTAILVRQMTTKHGYSLRNNTSFCFEFPIKKQKDTKRKIKYTCLSHQDMRMIGELENFLEKKGTQVIKRITAGVVKCVTQKYIKKLIEPHC